MGSCKQTALLPGSPDSQSLREETPSPKPVTLNRKPFHALPPLAPALAEATRAPGPALRPISVALAELDLLATGLSKGIKTWG